LLCLALLFPGCRRAEVSSYRVPKEKDQAMPAAVADNSAPAAPSSPNAPMAPAAGAGMAATPVATASGAGLKWTAPANWQAKAASAMRKGSYTVPGEGGATADLSITAFPGDVGGEAANVNRWRGQVSLQPFGDAEAAAAVTRITANGLTIGVVDFAGTGANAQRILGAMVPFGGATWFFKLMGPDAVVGAAKPAFLEFAKTIQPAPAAP
jgi:hypothetical protein